MKVGVSEATVSRVLNGKPGVSETTRDAVLTALDVLGYERPTQLRGERARLVGLVLPELQNPIFPALAEVVAGAPRPAGLHAGAVHPHGRRRVRGGLRRHAARPARLRHGLRRRELRPGRRPDTTTTSGCSSGACRSCWSTRRSSISASRGSATDDAAAVEQALRPPGCRSGHERIGLILGPDDHVPSRPQAGRVRGLAARAGIDTAGGVEHAMFSIEGGHAVGRAAACGHGVTGIICGSDPLALGAIRAARRLGLRVPDDVSVVGLRRLGVHDLHRSAADHGPPAHRRDGPGRGEHPGPAGRRGHGRIVRAALRAGAGRPGVHRPGEGTLSPPAHPEEPRCDRYVETRAQPRSLPKAASKDALGGSRSKWRR